VSCAPLRPTSGPWRAAVVGGGIAGLASAAALVRAGWQVTVLERAPAFAEVGAGLAVTANGMAALDAVGAGPAVRAAGYPVHTAGFQDPSGRWILRLPDVPPEPDGTNSIRGVHRQRLHAALLQAADAADLVTGAEVTAVQPGAPSGAPATVTWRTGSGERTLDCDLVVAADGVRSGVRHRFLPDAELAYSGFTSWRAVIDDTDRIDDRFIAAWGPATEFGVLRISPTEVYWYGYVRSPPGAVLADELSAARDHFAGWSALVTDIVGATPAGRLLRHDVHHLPGGLPRYVHGRVVLVGDAAHAVLPTMGQGANTALEDGACLGRLVPAAAAADGGLAAGLAVFDRARGPRCRGIARQSVTVARLGAHLPGGWRQSARNALLRHLPSGALVSAGARTTRWTPPPPAAAPTG
jgi:2-polyprenyl-6-methoxyphenol hydroxylase-like FAD-dependent oxidoreductase